MTPLIFSGIDLVEIGRFSQLDPAIRKRFYARVFTPEELGYIGELFNKAAGIFAAKEAVAKALGCGIGPISWQDINFTGQSARESKSASHKTMVNQYHPYKKHSSRDCYRCR